MSYDQNVSSRLPEREWCRVEMVDGGRYPVVTQLWLYDGEEDGNPIYHEFGLTVQEARKLARDLSRVAREENERGL